MEEESSSRDRYRQQLMVASFPARRGFHQPGQTPSLCGLYSPGGRLEEDPTRGPNSVRGLVRVLIQF